MLQTDKTHLKYLTFICLTSSIVSLKLRTWLITKHMFVFLTIVSMGGSSYDDIDFLIDIIITN